MDDEDLVAAYLRDGDPDDFRELVQRHQDRVFRLVASILGPFRDVEAEEVTQDVFLRVHERLSQFRGASRFASWLHRVAYNEAMDRRALARFRLPHLDMETLRAMAAVDDPVDELLTRERAMMVAAAVESLPDVYRTVVYLYYWNETPVNVIAEMLGVPAGTVRSYLHRARERMHRHLHDLRDRS